MCGYRKGERFKSPSSSLASISISRDIYLFKPCDKPSLLIFLFYIFILMFSYSDIILMFSLSLNPQINLSILLFLVVFTFFKLSDIRGVCIWLRGGRDNSRLSLLHFLVTF